MHTADDTAAWDTGVHVQLESLSDRRPEQSARRESFGMLSHGGKVQQKRHDKLMLEEDFVCLVTAEVVVGASFQKGQVIIQVDETQQNGVCVRSAVSFKQG